LEADYSRRRARWCSTGAAWDRTSGAQGSLGGCLGRSRWKAMDGGAQKSGWDRTSALVRSATLVVGTRQVRNIGWSPPCPARWGSARVGAPGTAREPSFLDSSESHSIHAGERVSECCSESCDCVSRSVARCSPCVVRSVPPGSSPLRRIKRTPSDGAPARTRRLDHTVGSATKEGATPDRGLWVPPSLPLARPSIGDPKPISISISIS